MPRVTGKLCNKNNVPTRTNAAFHDLTGGNAWMSGILATLDQANGNPVFDQGNYDLLSGLIDVDGLQKSAPALLDGEQRALHNLRRAADVVVVSETSTEATVRIINNTGHKLISGFPEGRRMWLNVRFVDSSGTTPPEFADDEINPYEELVTTTTRDLAAIAEAVGGREAPAGEDEKVRTGDLGSGAADVCNGEAGCDQARERTV